MKTNISDTDFYDFLLDCREKGGFSNEDIIATMMPLLKTISEIHSEGMVSTLDDISTVYVDNGHLNIFNEHKKPTFNTIGISRFFQSQSHAFNISEEYNQVVNIGEYISESSVNVSVDNNDTDTRKPIYLVDYQCFETDLGHHDPLTDIFIIGMIMASIAYNLDLTLDEDLKKFVDYRNQLVILNPRISPSIANIIIGMTELNRKKRWSDINEIIEKLNNYRDYNPEHEQDLGVLVEVKTKNRTQFIHEKLRNRLFDSSRRNRLLYYQPNLKFLNLTISSVPQVMDYKNIGKDSIFYWNSDVSKKIISGSSISLNKYLQTEENTYIIPTLDKIRLEANKDVNEYGFSQLKMVLCFLNWYNTKENSTEKIVTPLLLTSANLVKKKGIKDQYTLEFLDSEVEINPVLSNMLKELYDIRLPDSIQLTDSSIDDIYNTLKVQVMKNNSGIVLDYIDKPRIKLIHTQAVQTLGQYNKRNSKRRAITDERDLPYSYNVQDFQPLGLAMFRNYISSNPSSLEYLINKDIKLSHSQFSETKTVERDFYVLDQGSVNPYRWEFDTCNLVLGNFNYKKMSLVRDYNLVIENQLTSNVFDSLFNALAQKEFKTEITKSNNFTNNYNVVASDATQNNAVKYSEAKESYIIQGPPGTGKSQTIANLIANFVANDKKVLFVCEKRAALDVVFHRLSNQNLGQLCSLIHDSQADKKEFIMDLKKTFNDFTTTPNEFVNIENARLHLVSRIDAEINTLKDFHQFMNNTIDDGDFAVHQLFDVLISDSSSIDQELLNQLPSHVGYNDWLKYESAFEQLTQANIDTNQSPYFVEHPFAQLSQSTLNDLSNAMGLKNELNTLANTVENVNERLELLDLPGSKVTIEQYCTFLQACAEILAFFDKGNEKLLDSNQDHYQVLQREVTTLDNFQRQLVEISNKYPHWQQKLSETDAKSAQSILLENEGSFFKIFNGAFRQAKSLMESSYNFSLHSIKPKYSDVVNNLLNQFDLQGKINELHRKSKVDFGTENIVELLAQTDRVRNNGDQEKLSFIQSLNASDRKELGNIATLVQEIDQSAARYLHKHRDLDLSKLENLIQRIVAKQQLFPLYGTVFNDLRNLDKQLFSLIRYHKLSNTSLKNLLANNSMQSYFASNYAHQKYNMDVLNATIIKIKKLYNELLKLNGKYIISKQKNSLRNLLIKSEQSGAGIDRTLKKSILDGRKILENEFNKTMRYKSIREMATCDAGQIIREIKPVWLMSPLSVSDTLPLDEAYFDVVIFDEASQITLEEGIPPIYRAKQTIIVGDEMQMPPSNFFGSSSGNQDDLWQPVDDDINEYFSLDADSFLTQGARKFPSIMLGWHYRSRHEALIGFSNASFYDNQLLTIPDVKDHQNVSNEIIIDDCNLAKTHLVDVYKKPISYHYIMNGVYSARSNEKEAEYIAHLVRELLNDQTGLSIGIVAFSMEQQSVIESAIEDLCIKDKDFANVIEEEYKRIEENQFVGLFVKNLENVQGDERDIIIMSTCYGYDPRGKMLMNFGPINKRGGEKRLNVIFSRAKKSMVVVSSIKYADIKNEYNEGANYFRKYLQYAELISLGQIENANKVLNTINDKNNIDGNTSIAAQIRYELEAMGYIVNLNIGQSKFKCNLAIKLTASDPDYLLGIVIDDVHHYTNQDVLEQYLFKPEILKSNGWNICQIYAKDWLENRERVMQFIKNRIENKIEDVALEEEVIVEYDTPVVETSELELNPDPEVETQESITDVTSELNSDTKFDRYVCTTDGSHKFWEVAVDGKILIVQYGRIGTKGQRMDKDFETEALATNNMNKLIRQKLDKGYYKE